MNKADYLKMVALTAEARRLVEDYTKVYQECALFHTATCWDDFDFSDTYITARWSLYRYGSEDLGGIFIPLDVLLAHRETWRPYILECQAAEKAKAEAERAAKAADDRAKRITAAKELLKREGEL